MASLRQVIARKPVDVAVVFSVIIAVQVLHSGHFALGAVVNNRQKRADEPLLNIDAFVNDIGTRKEVDLVVLVDRSTGMGVSSFYFTLLQVVERIIKQYATVHPDYVRTAVVAFSKGSDVIYDHISNVNQNFTKSALFEGDDNPWDTVVFISDRAVAAGTNLNASLYDAKEILDAGQRNRPGATGIVLICTDGEFRRDPQPKAASLVVKGAGNIIYGLGIINEWFSPGSIRDLLTADDHFGDDNAWKNALSTEMSSVSSDTPAFWVRDTVCSSDCEVHNASCYSDIDRGFSVCLCKPGFYILNDICTVCPVGTYKENAGNETCSACPYEHTTDVTGATMRQQCRCIDTNTNCTDLCDGFVCGQNKECVQTDSTTTECRCITGFTGDNCTDNVDDCVNHQCQNGASCYDKVNDYQCACPFGYIGRYCEINRDDCVHELCLNNGTCLDGRNSFSCSCSSRYTGTQCQTIVDVPTTTTTTEEPPTTTTRPQPTTTTVMRSSTAPDQTTTTAPTTTATATTTSTPKPIPPTTADPTTDEEDDIMLYIIIGAAAGGGLLLIILIIGISCCCCSCCCACCACCNCRQKDADKDDLMRNKDGRKFSQRAKSRGPSLYNSISHKFNGIWKRKTVRGASPWLAGESGKIGLPSVPSRRPDVIEGHEEAGLEQEYTVMDDQIIVEEPVMSGWQKMVNELHDNGVAENAIIVKLNSEDRAQTPKWRFTWEEIERLEIIVEEQKIGLQARVQGTEFMFNSADKILISGQSIHTESVPKLIVVGKTKNFMIVGIADAHSDQGRLHKELTWVTDHIISEGY